LRCWCMEQFLEHRNISFSGIRPLFQHKPGSKLNLTWQSLILSMQLQTWAQMFREHFWTHWRTHTRAHHLLRAQQWDPRRTTSRSVVRWPQALVMKDTVVHRLRGTHRPAPLCRMAKLNRLWVSPILNCRVKWAPRGVSGWCDVRAFRCFRGMWYLGPC
jgi:hypothetical protein